MCSVCDYRTFDHVMVNESEKLEQPLGMGSLVMRCDTDGKNYTLSVKDEPKSEYRLYWCPTCGHKLF